MAKKVEPQIYHASKIEDLQDKLELTKDVLRDCVPYVNRVRIETDQPWRRETATIIMERIRNVLEGF